MNDEFDDPTPRIADSLAKLYQGERTWRYHMAGSRDPLNYNDMRFRRETEQDYLQFLYRVIHTISDRLKLDGDKEGAIRLIEALQIVDRSIRKAKHALSEASQERIKRYSAENCLKMLGELSKTTVFVPNWNADMDAWCTHSIPEKWNCVREGSGAYFLFHTMEGATLFKLNFAD